MSKKALFLLCALFFVQSKSDDCGDDFLKCFSELADSFFKNITEIEHVDAESIPGFKQVKDVELKSIAELTQSIQNELIKQLQSRIVDDAVVVTDNPKTKIYVKTFNHYFEDSFLPNFEYINPESDENETDEVNTLLGVESVSVESDGKDDNVQFTFLNRVPEDVVAISNNIKEKNRKVVVSEEPKEITSNNNSSIDSNNTSKEEQNTTVENISTITTESSIDNNNDATEQITTDYLSVTTQIIEINKELNKLEQKTTEIPSTNHKQNVKEEELAQKDLAEKQSNNETSQTKLNTPIHNTENILTDKQYGKDIRENIIQTDDNDYDIEDATDYPQIDYIDLYKDTTNEENVYVPTDSPKTVIDIKNEIVENVEQYSFEIDTQLDNYTTTNICHGNTSDVSNIFPWLATIFIKNDTANNQFQYICDGALLGDKLLITAARCVISNNSTVSTDDVLVFLGKRSLQSIGENERNVRISQIKIHNNFSNEDGKISNDLALLVLEEPVTFSNSIRPAYLGSDGDVEKSATTAWHITGALHSVFFEKNSGNCNEQNDGDGTFCATYGNAVALCPSHGGLHASRRASRWYLDGIRSGDPDDRGVCYDKNVRYTSIFEHLGWIMDNME